MILGVCSHVTGIAHGQHDETKALKSLRLVLMPETLP
jgi:hypothetical protein